MMYALEVHGFVVGEVGLTHPGPRSIPAAELLLAHFGGCGLISNDLTADDEGFDVTV